MQTGYLALPLGFLQQILQTLPLLVTRTKYWNLHEHLLWDDQIVEPDNNQIEDLIFHYVSYAGHLGVCKTMKIIQRYFTWLDIWSEAYVKYCPSCQVDKGNNTKLPVLMQPNEVPPYPGIL